MSSHYRDYLELLEKLGGSLDQLSETTEIKISAVRCDDLLALNDCIKQEQALAMGLRSMEKRRGELLNSMGLSGVPLSRLAESFPEELRSEAAAVSRSLKLKYDHYESASEAARIILEGALHQIEKMLPEEQRGSEPDRLPSALSTDIRA